MKKSLSLLIILNLFAALYLKADTNPNATPTVAPPPPPTAGPVQGPAFVCSAQSNVHYSVDTLPGIISYDWTIPAAASFVSGQGTNSIIINFGTTFGDVCVTANDGINITAASCITTSGAPSRPAMPTSISGPTTTVCPGQTIHYSVAADPLAESYDWVIPAHMTITSGAGTNQITVMVDTGFVWGYLRASASNCIGSSAQYVIAVYSAPGMPGSVTGPETGACEGGTYTYSFTPVNGATSYTWYAPTGCTVTSPVASGNPLTTSVTTVDITFPAGFALGKLYISSNSGCNSSDLRPMNIRSLCAKPGAIHGPFYGVCGLTGVQYFVDSVPGATSYSWSFAPSGNVVIHDDGNDTITVDFLSGYTNASFCVTANNTCGSSIARCGVVFAGPQTPIAISGPSGACNSNPLASIAYYSTQPVFGATDYLWSAPPGATITGGQGTTDITVDYMGASNGPVKVIARNACGSSQPRNLNIIVNPCRISQRGEIATASETKLFPNPANDFVNLTFETEESQKYMISVYDLTGREAIRINGISAEGLNSQVIETGDLTKGIYMIVLHTRDNSESMKLIRN